MRTTFSRHERHARGKALERRLRILKNSQILKDADLSGLPEEVIKSLSAGTCENAHLQKRYKLCSEIMAEMIEIETELAQMRYDMDEKKKKLQTPDKNVTDVN
jgi:hypothetical protein